MHLIGNGQLLATFGTTSSKHATPIGSLHAVTETMLVVSLSVVRLERSFHMLMLLFFYYSRLLSSVSCRF